MEGIVSQVLLSLGALLAAGTAALFGYWLFRTLGPFFSEIQDEAAGGSFRDGIVVAIRRLGTVNRQIIWPGYEVSIRKRLIRAGEPAGYKAEDILGLQELGFIVGLIFGLIAMALLDFHLGWSLLVAAMGGFYPLIWLNDLVTKRHLAISRALPFNLDLLTLSVEAGLDFTAALAKVVEKGKLGPLRDELGLVLKQLKMGKTREEALKLMIARVDLQPLTHFVTALIQADRMGTSLGRILRIQSSQLRTDRTQRAEKLANEAPVKMLFPLIACIFPTVFMVLFGPIIFAFVFGNITG